MSSYYDENTWHAMGDSADEGSDISRATLAYGLTDEQREWMTALVSEFYRHQDHNAVLKSYYDGDVRVYDYGMVSRIKNDQTCHWPAQAVHALASRVHFERFACEDGTAMSYIEDADAARSIVGGYNTFLPSKYLYGCMCATVNNGADGRPYVTFHDATTFTAISDGNHVNGGKVAAGLVVAKVERPWWDRSRSVPTVLHLHLPNNTVEIVQKNRGEWVAEQGRHVFDAPMMRVFSHESVGGSAPFGHTRINRFVRTLTEDAIRCMFHMQVSGTFYSMAKMYVTGLTDDQFDKMVADKDGYNLTRMLLLTANDETDRDPNVGQLSGNSPQPFVEELRSLAAQFSGATGVPLNSLGIVQDNPSSAEAIQAAREDICLVARRDIEADRLVLADVADLVLAMNMYTSDAPVTAKFTNPLLTSMSAQADWAVKVNAVRPSFGETDVAARLMGFDDADLADMHGDEDRAAARALIRSLAGNADANNGNASTEVVNAATA